MKILGIETSCDETAVAIVEATGTRTRPHFRILSNVVSSQVKLHAKYGGVVPNLARREHEKNLVPVLLTALEKLVTQNGVTHTTSVLHASRSKIEKVLAREPELLQKFKKRVMPLQPPAIDAIAVTVGPGLEPALWVGVNFARALASLWKKPLIPVNHLEGHIYSNWPVSRNAKHEARNIQFPAVCLIVSGGHTELILMKNYGTYTLLGATRDDAVGEAYDKVARILGLGYPGGPIVDAIATRYTTPAERTQFHLPRPMIDSKNYDFSFSGLKTAVLYLVRDLKKAGKPIPKRAVCREFQNAAIEVLVTKTFRAARAHHAKMIMVSGGVSANKGLRRAFGTLHNSHDRKNHSTILFPPPELTTDNAAMIAMAAYFRKRATDPHILSPRADLEMK